MGAYSNSLANTLASSEMLLRPNSIMGINQTKKANGVNFNINTQNMFWVGRVHLKIFLFSRLSNQSLHFLPRLKMLDEKNVRKTLLVSMNTFFGSEMSPNRDSGYVLILRKRYLYSKSGLLLTIIPADFR